MIDNDDHKSMNIDVPLNISEDSAALNGSDAPVSTSLHKRTESTPKSPLAPASAVSYDGSSPSPPPSSSSSSSVPADSSTDDFLQVDRMDGYSSTTMRTFLYVLSCVLSCGMVFLANLWFADTFVPYRYKRTPLASAQYVYVAGRIHGSEMIRVVDRTLQDAADELDSVKVPKVTTMEDDDHNNLSSSSSSSPSSPSMLRRSSNDLLHVEDRHRMIIFRHMRYIYHPIADEFVLQKSDVLPSHRDIFPARHQTVANLKAKEITERIRTGLTEEQYLDNLLVFGSNALILTVPSIPSLLFSEVLHPFYVFQMYSVILWGFESYWIFAGAILFIATVSIIQTLIETRRRMTELAALARYDAPVTVLRNSTVIVMSSTKLVPGDIVHVQTGLVPCDMTLLSGSVVVNESMLTGESVPVVKSNVQFPLNRHSDAVMNLSADRHMLMASTKTMQLKPTSPGLPVLAMVVRSGFATAKGSLIMSILFPKPSEFKFEQQSYKFIAALFGVALIGFGVSIWQLHWVQHSSWGIIIIRACDLVTIVVPPSLPLALSVGTNFALRWLKREKIFCISPSRITMAGKIKCVCFDKTGTLTAESLEFMGIYPSVIQEQQRRPSASSSSSNDNSTAKFGQFQSPNAAQMMQLGISSSSGDMIALVNDTDDGPTPDRRAHDRAVIDTTNSVSISAELKVSMACCQSLAVLESELIGDPLEVQTFMAAGAHMQDAGELQGYHQIITVETSIGHSTTMGVVDQFEFSSTLQRMSVLCTDMISGQHWSFVKGSPEMMSTLCVPSSLPPDFSQALAYFAHQGYRVIAIARKEMKNIPELEKSDMRLVVESDLIFLGLILLENKVKPESAPTLKILRAAGVRCVMVSGDNPLTCVTVAFECQLIEPGTRVFQSILVADSAAKNGQRLEWVDTQDDNMKLDSMTLRLPASAWNESNGMMKYELAVTGTVYKLLQDDIGSADPGSLFHRVVLSGQIFARMSPDQKASLVNEFQGMGIYTGMCGDGGNDCAALKTAHVGVSLSESEASIAAPFTYQRPNISCIPILLSEGRSSLVTSFQLFRFMAMYSMIQFGACLLTYFQGSVLGNYQYLYQDLWVVFPLTIFMGATRANRNLSMKRPSGNLLSIQNLSNLLVHIMISVVMQIILYITIINYSDFTKLPNAADGSNSFVTTASYYFSNFQYPIIAIFFSLGRPWKASILTNWKFCAWIAISLICSVALLFSPLQQPGFFRTDDVVLFQPWTIRIGIYVAIYFVAVLLWDRIVFPLAVVTVRRWKESRDGFGMVYGRKKRVEGQEAKLYHRLRGEFEQGWKRD